MAKSQKLEAYAPLNNFFETEIQIGSRRQPLMLVVDTGSSWTWITFDKCQTDKISPHYDDPIAISQDEPEDDAYSDSEAEEFLKKLMFADEFQ